MASAFNDREKRYLLAEMIRVSETDITALVEFVKANAVGYNFYSIIAPPGHSLEQCVQAAESLLEMPMPPSSLERAPVSASPTRRLATILPPSGGSPATGEPAVTMPPMPLGLPPAPFSPVSAMSRGSHIRIQPRPPTANGQTSNVTPPTQPEGPPPKKRRGRPPRKRIDYISPLVAPKLAPLASHSQHGQVPGPPPQALPGQSLASGTPPGEGSNPGTPTPAYSATPATTAHSQLSSAGGTPRGKKRGRPGLTDSNAEPRSVENPLPSFRNTPPVSVSKTTATTASPPWPMATTDRSSQQLGLPRGPTLPPLTQGEPSTQPMSPMKTDRPAPLAT